MKDENIKKSDNSAEDTVSKVADAVGISEDALASAMEKTGAYSDTALESELEQLAEIFKTEYKKAQTMSEDELLKNGYLESNEPEINPEELCECCGERRKDKSEDKNSEYCAECREAMRRYPLSVSEILVSLAVLIVAVASVFYFAADFVKYNTVRQADEYRVENKLFSALSAYEGAISAFEDEDKVAKRLYLDAAEIIYQIMPQGVSSMSQLVTSIDSALSDTELKIPIYKGYSDLREETLVLYGTMQKFYEIVEKEEYAELTADDDELYEKIMTEIGKLIDADISITAENGDEIKVVKCNEAIVRFCQYMFAYTAEKYDDSYMYMKKVEELEPGYLWLYAYELGTAELQRGNPEKAKELAQLLCDNNAEAVDGYTLYSSIYRMTKGGLNKAVEWADKGLAVSADEPELYRIKAMAYAASGEFEKAKETVDKGLEKSQYGLIVFTAMVIENELGNEDAVEEYRELLEEQKVELTERMNKYFKGKLTAKELFTEGTGEVE